MKLNIYWKFWFAFFWRLWAVTFVIVIPAYILISLYRGEAQTAVQNAMSLATILGPFIQVAVFKHLFTHRYQGFDAKLTAHEESANG